VVERNIVLHDNMIKSIIRTGLGSLDQDDRIKSDNRTISSPIGEKDKVQHDFIALLS